MTTMMNSAAITSWLASTSPLGSDTYYALNRLEPEIQQAIKIILAVFHTIMSMPFTMSDDEIVRAKLRWWKEEIIKAQQQHASHPLCIALYPIMEKYELNYNALLQCITAIENQLQNCQFPDEKSLRDYYTYTYGIRERMIAKITCAEAKQHAEAIHHLAYTLGLIDNLQHIKSRAAKTYIFFTDEEAKELSVDKSKLLTLKISDDAKKLFQSHIDKAKKHFQIGVDMVRATTGGSTLQPLLLRAYLGLKWCDLVSEAQFPLFTHHIELTPLRRWWLSRRFIKTI